MAATTKLARFSATESGEGFSLRIEDEAGAVLEFSASRDQVDLIVDTLDDLLSQDDSADEIAPEEGEDDAYDEDEDDEILDDDEDDEGDEGDEGRGGTR